MRTITAITFLFLLSPALLSQRISKPNYGLKSPSLKLDGTGDAVETPTLSSAATELAFWCKGQSTNAESALLIEGYNGSSWVNAEIKRYNSSTWE